MSPSVMAILRVVCERGMGLVYTFVEPSVGQVVDCRGLASIPCCQV